MSDPIFFALHDKLLDINKLAHVSPTQDGSKFVAHFTGCQQPLWLTPDQYKLLLTKLKDRAARDQETAKT